MAGGAVLIDELNDAYPLTTTNSGALAQAVGVAMADVVDESYFWAWRGCGLCEALVTNGQAAANLTTTATPGELGAGGDVVIGLRNVDQGVTSTRVTVFAAGFLATNT